MAISPWDLQSVETLIHMHSEDTPARVIAVALQEAGYNVTRNAVIGKIHRLKLAPRPQERPFGLPPRPKPKIVVTRSLQHRSDMVRSEPMKVESLPTPPPEGSKTIPFMDIKDGQCKAILGYQDGQLSKALCCGRRTRRLIKGHRVIAASWCDYHMELFTQEKYR